MRTEFGARLRTARGGGGLSQDALSRLTDLHRNAIYRLEKARTDPRLTSIRSLARNLRVPPRELVEDDGEGAALGA